MTVPRTSQFPRARRLRLVRRWSPGGPLLAIERVLLDEFSYPVARAAPLVGRQRWPRSRVLGHRRIDRSAALKAEQLPQLDCESLLRLIRLASNPRCQHGPGSERKQAQAESKQRQAHVATGVRQVAASV